MYLFWYIFVILFCNANVPASTYRHSVKWRDIKLLNVLKQGDCVRKNQFYRVYLLMRDPLLERFEFLHILSHPDAEGRDMTDSRLFKSDLQCYFGCFVMRRTLSYLLVIKSTVSPMKSWSKNAYESINGYVMLCHAIYYFNIIWHQYYYIKSIILFSQYNGDNTKYKYKIVL